MKMDEADYRLLISAMQENYAEAGASVVDGAIGQSQRRLQRNIM